MSTDLHTPWSFGGPLTSAAMNAPLAQLDAAIGANGLSVVAFGATGNGATDDATAIQDALDTVSAAGGGTVVFPAGTYIVGTQLSVYSNTTMLGSGGATIKAKASMTWASGGLIKVGTTGQSNIAVRGLVIDGNQSNNTYNFDRQLVAVLDADDFTVDGCTIRGVGGIGVYVSTGKRARITGNTISDVGVSCIYVWSSGDVDGSDVRIVGNTLSNMGRHAINVMGHRGVTILDNSVTGILAGTSDGTPMQCDFAGATVTRDSGSDFLNDLRVGNFLVANPNGTFTEYGINSITNGDSAVVGVHSITSSAVGNPSVITHDWTDFPPVTGDVVLIAGHTGSTPNINGTHTVTVVSPTTFTIPVNVTVGGTGGTVHQSANNVTPVAGGTGDLIEVQGCADVSVIGNKVQTGVSIGISVWANTSTTNGRSVIVANNTVRNIGGPGVSIGSSDTEGLTGVLVTGNIISNVGRRGAAGNVTDYNVGIVVEEAGGTITQCYISDNVIYDDQNTPTTDYWLRLMSSVDAGDIAVGRNHVRSTVYDGIAGGVTITPDAGWGSTAAISDVVFHGTKLIFTVTAGGTGIAANPSITIAPKVTAPESPPVPHAVLFNLATAAHDVLTLGPGATPDSFYFTYWQTPGSGQACQITVHW